MTHTEADHQKICFKALTSELIRERKMLVSPIRLLCSCVLLAFSLLITPQSTLALNQCPEGRPLAALINNADAIAVIEEKQSFTLPIPTPFGLRLAPVSERITASIIEVIKPSLAIPLLPMQSQQVFLEDYRPRSMKKRRRFLAFLTYLSPGNWKARRCEYLYLSADNMAQDACSVINDLFGQNPYVREKLCLLNYPPSAGLQEIKAEIIQASQEGVQFAGSAKFVQNGKWFPLLAYQLVVFELDAQSRKAFFAKERNFSSFPIKAYIKSGDLSEEKFQKYVRQGIRFKFHGKWQQSSFIIESIEWMSGRAVH